MTLWCLVMICSILSYLPLSSYAYRVSRTSISRRFIRVFSTVQQFSEASENAVPILLPIESKSQEVKFVVYGEPLALARHRVTRFGSMYNPSSGQQMQFQKKSLAHLPSTPLSGPIEADISFYFSRPKSHYRTGKYSDILKPNVDSWCARKPGKFLRLFITYLFSNFSIFLDEFILDLDNLVKFVLDSLNEKAFIDDSQVVQMTTKKLYTNYLPRVEIALRTLNESAEPEVYLPPTLDQLAIIAEAQKGSDLSLGKKRRRKKKQLSETAKAEVASSS